MHCQHLMYTQLYAPKLGYLGACDDCCWLSPDLYPSLAACCALKQLNDNLILLHWQWLASLMVKVNNNIIIFANIILPACNYRNRSALIISPIIIIMTQNFIILYTHIGTRIYMQKQIHMTTIQTLTLPRASAEVNIGSSSSKKKSVLINKNTNLNRAGPGQLIKYQFWRLASTIWRHELDRIYRVPAWLYLNAFVYWPSAHRRVSADYYTINLSFAFNSFLLAYGVLHSGCAKKLRERDHDLDAEERWCGEF